MFSPQLKPQFPWECQFSSTANRRLQNDIPFPLRDKQLAVRPAEGYIRFRPRLLLMFASRQ